MYGLPNIKYHIYGRRAPPGQAAKVFTSGLRRSGAILDTYWHCVLSVHFNWKISCCIPAILGCMFFLDLMLLRHH